MQQALQLLYFGLGIVAANSIVSPSVSDIVSLLQSQVMLCQSSSAFPPLSILEPQPLTLIYASMFQLSFL